MSRESIKDCIRKYRENFEIGKLPRKVEKCHRCRYKGRLYLWSKYLRAVKTLAGTFQAIPIKRLRCNKCGATFNLLPKFLIKFCRYGRDVVVYSLKELKEKSYDKVAEALSFLKESIYVAVHTLILWKKKYSLTDLY